MHLLFIALVFFIIHPYIIPPSLPLNCLFFHILKRKWILTANLLILATDCLDFLKRSTPEPGNFYSGRQAEDTSGNWCRSYIEHSIEPNVRSPFLSFGAFVHHMHHETSLLQLKMLARLQLLIKFIQWMLLRVHKEKAAVKWKWLSKKKNSQSLHLNPSYCM